jgi:hypothetical protein
LKEDRVPENPIRRFLISPQIFNLIKGSLMDPELETLPTDYHNGLDFTITKTSKGGYADYSTSKWARRETALSGADIEIIEKYGLFNLGEFLPKKPGEVELRVIKEMFEASVNGEEYNAECWAQFYKPPGLEVNASASTTNSSSSSAITLNRASAEITDDEDNDVPTTAPVKTPVPAEKTSSQRAEDILAMIRNRQK